MKFHDTCRCSPSKNRRQAGFLLFEALIVAGVLSGFLFVILVTQRAHVDMIRRMTGKMAANAVVDAELGTFSTSTFGGTPDTTPVVRGISEGGDQLRVIRRSSLDTRLGIRKFEATCVIGSSSVGIAGGTSRLESLDLPLWAPLPDTLAHVEPSMHLLTILVPSGGTVVGDGMASFGSVVTITATPSMGKAFVRWDGDAIVADKYSASTTVTIDEDRTLTAIFH